MGHLIGNRFGVNLYGVTADDETITACCNHLMSHGFINYFGVQRFGYHGDNIAQGLRVLQGGKARHQQMSMYISALQSAMFNLYAGHRFEEKGFDVCEGDVIQKIGGGCFVCDDQETDQARAIRGEIAVTGSLPGKKVKLGHGYTMNLEEACARAFGVNWPEKEGCEGLSLNAVKKLAEGDRRQMWIRPSNVSFKRVADPDCVHIDFDLPSGCYATVLLRHLCGPTFTR